MYILIIYLFIFKFDINTTIMSFNPADNIQDLQNFGEFGGVNPSISDSSTYTFMAAKTV